MSTQTKQVGWFHRHQAESHAATPAASARPQPAGTAAAARSVSKQRVNALMHEIFTIESGFGLTDTEAARLDEIEAELSRSGREAVPWIRWQIESDLAELLPAHMAGR